jgi:hypothetical protein
LGNLALAAHGINGNKATADLKFLNQLRNGRDFVQISSLFRFAQQARAIAICPVEPVL